MYQLDEKLMSDARALIALAPTIELIEGNLKDGMMLYTSTDKQAYMVSGEKQYRRFLLESENGDIEQNLSFAGNVIFKNGLTIEGEITNVETKDLVISDNIIELNKDETGDGISKGSSGLLVNRGTRPNYMFTFNEGDAASSDVSGAVVGLAMPGQAVIGTVGGTRSVKLASITHKIGTKVISHLYENGDHNIIGKSYSNGIVSKSSADITGALTVSDVASIGNNLTVGGLSTLTGAVSAKSHITADGNLTSKGTLQITGLTTLRDNLDVHKNLTVNGQTDLTGSTQIGGDLAIMGTTHANAINATDLTLNGAFSTDGDAIFGANVSVGNNLTVANTTNLRTLEVSELAALNQVTAVQTSVTNLTVQNEATFNCSTNTTGSATIGEELITTTLSVGADATVYGNLYTTHTITTNAINVNADATIGGAMRSDSILTNHLSVSTDTSLTNLSVSGTTSLLGGASVNGITSLDRLSVANASTFNGAVTINGTTDMLTAQATALTVGKTDTNVAITPTEIKLNDVSKNYKVNLTGGIANVVSNLEIKTVATNNTILHMTANEIKSNKPMQIFNEGVYSNVLTANTKHKNNHAFGGHDYLSPADIKAVADKGIPELYKGVSNNKPVLTGNGKMFYASDAKAFYFDEGSEWVKASVTHWDELNGKPVTFTPPIATTTRLGGIKAGRNVNVAADGTLSVPDTVIEYVTERTAFVLEEATNTLPYEVPITDELHKYMLSVYLWGQLIPNDNRAYVVREGKIIFNTDEPLAVGTPVEVIALRVPIYAAFAQKQECYISEPGQTVFKIRGHYTINKSNLKVYVYGSLLPENAYEKTNSQTITLKDSPATGSNIIIEYLDDPFANTDTMVPNTVHIQESAATVWTVTHNQLSYPLLLAVDQDGFKIDPISTQYVDYNTVVLTFSNAVRGTVHVTR